MIDRKVLHCEFCDKDFKSGDWTGCGGYADRSHRIKAKTYYHPTSDGIVVSIMAGRDFIDVPTGTKIHIPDKVAYFAGGQCTTDDPETQEVLDHKGYLVDLEGYKDARETPKLKAERAKTQLLEEKRLHEATKAQLAALQAQQAAKRDKVPA